MFEENYDSIEFLEEKRKAVEAEIDNAIFFFENNLINSYFN